MSICTERPQDSARFRKDYIVRETKLANLIDSCVEHEQASSVELQVCGGVFRSLEFLERQLTLIFAGNPSWRYGGSESGVPRRGIWFGRWSRINFIGLTGTMLSNDDASALASALNFLADRAAAPASREATLASQERQDIPRIAETCSVLGATPLNRSAGNLNTLHLILPSPSLPLLNGPAHVRIASSLETMRVKQA